MIQSLNLLLLETELQESVQWIHQGCADLLMLHESIHVV